MKIPFFLLLFIFFQLTILNAQQSVSLNIGMNSSKFFDRTSSTIIGTTKNNRSLLVSIDYQFTNKKIINWKLALSFQGKNGLGLINYRAPGGGFSYDFDVKMAYFYLSIYPEFYFEKLRFIRLNTGPQLGLNVFTKGSALLHSWSMNSGIHDSKIDNVSGYFKKPDFRWFVGVGFDFPIADFTKLSLDFKGSIGFTELPSFVSRYFLKLNTIDYGMTLGFKRWF